MYICCIYLEYIFDIIESIRNGLKTKITEVMEIVYYKQKYMMKIPKTKMFLNDLKNRLSLLCFLQVYKNVEFFLTKLKY